MCQDPPVPGAGPRVQAGLGPGLASRHLQRALPSQLACKDGPGHPLKCAGISFGLAGPPQRGKVASPRPDPRWRHWEVRKSKRHPGLRGPSARVWRAPSTQALHCWRMPGAHHRLGTPGSRRKAVCEDKDTNVRCPGPFPQELAPSLPPSLSAVCSQAEAGGGGGQEEGHERRLDRCEIWGLILRHDFLPTSLHPKRVQCQDPRPQLPRAGQDQSSAPWSCGFPQDPGSTDIRHKWQVSQL